MSSVMSKEKIVALTLDIEDKEKVIVLLERKVELARSQLNDLDDNVSQRFQRVTQDKANEHKRLLDELSTETQNLMKEKADYIKSCKDLMEIIQDTDRDNQAEVRGIYREGEESIESERKVFKQGYDERLAKFMAQKAQEYRDSTNRAMDPEFKRLQALHDHDMNRLKLDAENEHRRLQETMKQRLDNLKEEEKKGTKEEMMFLLKAIQDKCARELDQLAQEFKQKGRVLRSDYERQLEKHQKQLKDKAAKLRRDRHQELNDVHDLGQERLVSMKQKHVDVMQKMTKEHEQKIRTFRREADEEKRRLERKYRDKQLAANGSPGKSPAGRPRSLYRPSPPKQFNDNDDDDDGSDIHRYADEFEPVDETSNKAKDELLTPAQREELVRVREEQETHRDKQLQTFIRSLEVESLKLEREWKTRLEKEEKKLNELTSKEHEQLSRRLRQINEDIADGVVEREQLHRVLQEEKQREEQYQEELTKLRHEVTVYEDGIAAQRSRLQDKTQQHQLALRGLHLEYGPQVRELQHEITTIEQQMQQYAQQWEEDQVLLENEHAEALATLDRQVKEDVSQLDVEIVRLKEEMDEERVKQQRLQVLLARYGGGGDGGGGGVGEAGATNTMAGATGTIPPLEDDVGDDDEEEEEELHVTRRPLGVGGHSNGSTVSSRSRQVPKHYQQEDDERQARLRRVGAAMAALTSQHQPNSPQDSRVSATSGRRAQSAGRVRPSTSDGGGGSVTNSGAGRSGSSVRSRIVPRKANNSNNANREDEQDDGQHTVHTTTTQRTASTASYSVANNNRKAPLRSSTGTFRK